MQIPSGQSGAAGPNANVEFMERMGQYTIPANTTVFTGATFCRSIQQLQGPTSTQSASTGANPAPAGYASATGGGQPDVIVLPNDANAGDPFGVYYGPNIPPQATAQVVNIPCRFRGPGPVIVAVTAANISVAVNSGLIVSSGAGQYPIAGSRAIGITVGQAIATTLNSGVLVSAPAAVLVGIAGSPVTVAINADINCI